MWIIEQSAGVQPQKTSRTVITDDRGQYRFFDLAPHSYVLAATVYEPFAAPQFFTRRGAARERPVPTYYPGVTNESYAQAISVSAGEHQSAIDFTIQTAPSTIVTGTVGGRPEDRLECSILLVRKQQSYSAARVSESYRQDAAVDGSFRFVDVSPGQYWIQARIVSSSQGREILWAAQDINVMSDDLRVVLTPRPASKVLGRLHVQSSITQTLFQTRHTVSLIPARDFLYGASGSVAALLDTFNGEVSSDGTFVIPGLPAGRYRLSVIPARPGVSMYLNIDNHLAIDDVRDVAVVVEEPGPLKLEIEVFEQPQRLSGRLTAPAPIVASSFQVLVFPINRSYWTGISQIRSVVVREDGQYQVSGLRPGDYYVAAVADIREQELGDVQFLLAQSKLGSRVSIAPGQEAVHNIAVDPNQLRGSR
jgi:hypothetical protein